MTWSFGTQLHAPVGFLTFRANSTYYFAGEGFNNTVNLIWFNKGPRGWRVYIIRPQRSDFEVWLTASPPKLRPAEIQRKLPEWLEDVEHIEFDDIEAQRPGDPSETYREEIKHRALVVSDALAQEDVILRSRDVIKILNQYAYNNEPTPQHPHRYQLWFFAFILHGRTMWALKSPTHNKGVWDRASPKHCDKKFGRNSSDPHTCFNSPSNPYVDTCAQAYLDRCGPGVTMKFIYQQAMTKELGCIAVDDKNGNPTYIHPNGGAILSYGQFRECVVKKFGLGSIQTTLYGEARMRAKAKANKGNNSQQYNRLMEAVEVDAYHSKERAKAMLSDDTAATLVVARCTCCTTGSIAGVGFSIGGEAAEAYRAMLFCCVVEILHRQDLWTIPWRSYGLAYFGFAV